MEWSKKCENLVKLKKTCQKATKKVLKNRKCWCVWGHKVPRAHHMHQRGREGEQNKNPGMPSYVAHQFTICINVWHPGRQISRPAPRRSSLPSQGSHPPAAPARPAACAGASGSASVRPSRSAIRRGRRWCCTGRQRESCTIFFTGTFYQWEILPIWHPSTVYLSMSRNNKIPTDKCPRYFAWM